MVVAPTYPLNQRTYRGIPARSIFTNTKAFTTFSACTSVSPIAQLNRPRHQLSTAPGGFMKLTQITALNVQHDLPAEEQLRSALIAHQLNPQPQVKSQEYGWCAVHKDSDEPYLGAMQVDLMRFCL